MILNYELIHHLLYAICGSNGHKLLFPNIQCNVSTVSNVHINVLSE